MKRGIFTILLLIVILAALLSAYFIREKDESASVMTGDAEAAALQAGAEGLTEYLLIAAAPEETDHSDNDSAEPDEAAFTEDREASAAYSEMTDYSNPYVSETETMTGSYLYEIYKANKGCDASGEWFIGDSERFTYYEIYDPLDDEHLDANWVISLSEMKGADKLAQAVNKYHAELFDSQKKMMQEHQKEVMAMDIKDYSDHLNGSQYSDDIITKASFEWGNIFIVVDMEDTMYTYNTAMPANFNRETGKKYEFSDLFSTDDYNEELLGIIDKNQFDGQISGWDFSDPDSFSFAMSCHGLLLCQNWRSIATLFIEWSELEDILAPEIKSDVLKYADWNNETAEPADTIAGEAGETAPEKDKMPSAEVEEAALAENAVQAKDSNTITVMAKETFYKADGRTDYWNGYDYDDAGNMTKESCYNADGSIGFWDEYEYDSAGNQIKMTRYYPAYHLNDLTYEYEYDSAGNMIKEIYSHHSGFGWEYGYEYDSTGNMIKKTYYDDHGNMDEWIEYEYDHNGNQTKETICGADGSIQHWYEYAYDSAGNITKETRYNDDGSAGYCREQEYEYDGAGNLTGKFLYNDDGSRSVLLEKEYDSRGNLTKETYYDNDENIDYWKAYEYDSMGNLTKETEVWCWKQGEYICYEAEYITLEADGPAAAMTKEAEESEPVTVMVKMSRYDDNFTLDNLLDWQEESEYDSMGNKVKETMYDADASIQYWYEWEYDSAGNQMKQTKYYPDGRSNIDYEREYDSAGNETKVISYSTNGSVSSQDEYEYDSAGNMTKETHYDRDGSINYWQEYEYDSDGNRTKWSYFLADGSAGHWYEYEYDSAGNEIRQTYYDGNGNLDRWNEREYDSKGNLTKETSYDTSGGCSWDEYEYDAAGNETRWTIHERDGYSHVIRESKYDSMGRRTSFISYYLGGGMDVWCKYKYDSNGKLIKDTHYNEDGSIEKWYEYEYDSEGNLAKEWAVWYRQPENCLAYEAEYMTIIPQRETDREEMNDNSKAENKKAEMFSAFGYNAGIAFRVRQHGEGQTGSRSD